MNERIDVQSLELVYKFALPEPVVETGPKRGSELAGLGRREVAPGRADGSRGRDAPGSSRSGKVGRNDPCPCGSGKKYKKCCGAA